MNNANIQDQPPFDMAIDEDARDDQQIDNRNDEIPNEIPDHRKTTAHGNMNLNWL